MKSYFFFLVVFFEEDFLVVAFFFFAMALLPPFWGTTVKLGEIFINGILRCEEKFSDASGARLARATRMKKD